LKARDLFYDEIAAFRQTDETLQEIFGLLLNDQEKFSTFFGVINYSITNFDLEKRIRQKFQNEICEQADLTQRRFIFSQVFPPDQSSEFWVKIWTRTALCSGYSGGDGRDGPTRGAGSSGR